MDFTRMPWKHIIIVAIEVTFAVNILLLNIWVLNLAKNAQQTSHITAQSQVIPTPTIHSPLADVSPVLVPSPTTTFIQQSVVQVAQSTSGVKEFFAPFGGGQSIASTWANVPGLQAYIDSSAYPNMKSVVFEASVYIPTGNQTASVQLFNVTQQHPVWFSEVDMSGGAPQFLVSRPIQLDSGNNLYQVQMQTQLQFPAQLTQSRLHITLQ